MMSYPERAKGYASHLDSLHHFIGEHCVVRSAQEKDCFVPSSEMICRLSHTGVIPSAIRGVAMTVTETAVGYPRDYLLLA